MDLSIRRFGRPSREAVGVFQKARGNGPARARYLLCRPLGQEAVRTAAVFRVLSDRLARDGCESLRFDYHGTGDAPGEEEQQTLDGWVEDTLEAHAELARAGTPNTHWFGMGLGATIALRAAALAPVPPTHLVLWEPVLDGSVYTNALLNAHRAELTREFGETWERLLRIGKVVEPVLPGDVLGFQVGAQLAAELQQIREPSFAPALERGVRITCAIRTDQREQAGRIEGSARARIQPVEAQTNWMSSQAMGTAIVPPDLPRTLLSTL